MEERSFYGTPIVGTRSGHEILLAGSLPATEISTVMGGGCVGMFVPLLVTTLPYPLPGNPGWITPTPGVCWCLDHQSGAGRQRSASERACRELCSNLHASQKTSENADRSVLTLGSFRDQRSAGPANRIRAVGAS